MTRLKLPLKILFLEPFYGGSHKNFADGLIEHSRHRFDLFTLPARFWKWRMRGAALHFIKKIPDISRYDLLFATNMMSLSDFISLGSGAGAPPAVLYFHENQLSYPLPEGEKMDYHFGFTDISSALAAQKIVFNSHSHRRSFVEQLSPFIRTMPEYKPLWAADELSRKAAVLYPGCRFPAAGPWPSPPGTGCGGPEQFGDSGAALPEEDAAGNGTPLIIWNHRWEFDKQPEVFFSALEAAERTGCSFRLALLGENFQSVPKAFIKAKKQYGGRVLVYGYEKDRRKYKEWLRNGDIVISTAIQENFGISILEAVRAGCFPLLPRRLSYPELLPRKYHGECLYANDNELTEKLIAALRFFSSEKYRHIRKELSRYCGIFSWERRIKDFDDLFCSVCYEREEHCNE